MFSQKNLRKKNNQIKNKQIQPGNNSAEKIDKGAVHGKCFSLLK
jgi:hypothetical protein